MIDYFSKLFCRNCPNNLRNIFFGLGILTTTFSTLGFFYKQYYNWKWIPKHFENKKTVNKDNFIKRYGDGHAIITGGAQGIGYAYA